MPQHRPSTPKHQAAPPKPSSLPAPFISGDPPSKNRLYHQYINKLKRSGSTSRTSLAGLLNPHNAGVDFDNMAYRRLCHMSFSPTSEWFANSPPRNLIKEIPLPSTVG